MKRAASLILAVSATTSSPDWQLLKCTNGWMKRAARIIPIIRLWTAVKVMLPNARVLDSPQSDYKLLSMIISAELRCQV
jgi:hypothetical protein